MRSRPVPRGVRLYDPATLARLCRARDYLADHFHERPSLSQAAQQAYLSPFYFGRLFAGAFGETPHEFVTRLRIERAKRMLLADHASVTDICFDVGYESLGSFSTRFHLRTGLSPAAFRREARRIFGFGKWRLFYVPACYRHFYLHEQGGGTAVTARHLPPNSPSPGPG
jgi:AraC-like DNA-binding protein